MQTFTPKGNIVGPILPSFILTMSITSGAKIMYALLCNYAGTKDYCWPSQATLASQLSCSVNSIKNYIAELVKAKLIAVTREQHRSSKYHILLSNDVVLLSDKKKTSNKNVSFYTNNNSAKTVTTNLKSTNFTQPNIGYVTQPKVDAIQPSFDRTQPKFGYINNINKQDKEITPPLAPKASKASTAKNANCNVCESSLLKFEKLWKLYPKKEARGFALIAWSELQKNSLLPSMEILEQSIKLSCNSEKWQKEQGRFIPLLSNWLRGQRWLDITGETKELIKQEHNTKLTQELIEQEKANETKQKAENEVLRPLFDAFIEKFSDEQKGHNTSPAFGYWSFLHNNFYTLKPSDVPLDNKLNLIDFLKDFRMICQKENYKCSKTL